jgi:hypothetical protein
MNCHEFHSVIHALAREESAPDAALNAALAHAESCRDCDALLREAERLTAELRKLAMLAKSEAAPACVEAALFAAFREQHTPALRARRASAWLAVPAAGLAAAALLLGLLVRGPADDSRPSPTAPATAPRQSNPGSGPREVWADYMLEGETAEEAAAAFIPLNAAFDPAWIEGGAIVRVVLSRPALQNLGVPVGAAGDSEFVADMVVSGDGTPEAIRLVDWTVGGAQ